MLSPLTGKTVPPRVGIRACFFHPVHFVAAGDPRLAGPLDRRGRDRMDMQLLPHVWRDADSVDLSGKKKDAKAERTFVFSRDFGDRTELVGFEQYRDNIYYPVSVRVKRRGSSDAEQTTPSLVTSETRPAPQIL